MTFMQEIAVVAALGFILVTAAVWAFNRQEQGRSPFPTITLLCIGQRNLSAPKDTGPTVGT